MGKRRRKDEPEQYYAVNMNVHSQLYDDDHAHLYHVDGDVDNHQDLPILANAGDNGELSPMARAVDGGQLCDVTDNVDCDITGGVDELPSDHVAEEADSKISCRSDEKLPPGSHGTFDVAPQSTLNNSEDVALQNDYNVLA